MQYFKHMSNMRHDLKIRKLIKKYGLKGYGLYNLIIESISENLTTKKPLPSLEETCEDIAILYNENSTEIEEIVLYMKNQELLEIDSITNKIMCYKIYNFLEASQTRSEAIRIMIKSFKKEKNKLLSKNTKNVSDKNDIIKTVQQKNERIRKRIKNKKKNKENIDKDVLEIYKSYPSKCPIKNSNTNKTIKNKDQIKKYLLENKYTKEYLLESIKLYINDCIKSKTWIKNFSSFLNNIPDLEEFKKENTVLNKPLEKNNQYKKILVNTGQKGTVKDLYNEDMENFDKIHFDGDIKYYKEYIKEIQSDLKYIFKNKNKPKEINKIDYKNYLIYIKAGLFIKKEEEYILNTDLESVKLKATKEYSKYRIKYLEENYNIIWEKE